MTRRRTATGAMRGSALFHILLCRHADMLRSSNMVDVRRLATRRRCRHQQESMHFHHKTTRHVLVTTIALNL